MMKHSSTFQRLSLPSKAAILLFAAVAFVSGPSQAATIQYSTSIALDPANLSADHTVYAQHVLGAPIFQLQAGDTITGTITFSNGSLSILNQTGASGQNMYFLTTGTQAGTHWISTVLVLGLTGNLGISNPATFDISGGSIVGAEIFSGQAAQNFSFTGFTYTLNVLSVILPNNQEAIVPFSFFGLNMSGEDVEVNIDSIPEPVSISLVFCGLSLIAARARIGTR